MTPRWTRLRRERRAEVLSRAPSRSEARSRRGPLRRSPRGAGSLVGLRAVLNVRHNEMIGALGRQVWQSVNPGRMSGASGGAWQVRGGYCRAKGLG